MGLGVMSIPSRVRSDHGGENTGIWRKFVESRGCGETCMYTSVLTSKPRTQFLFG